MTTATFNRKEDRTAQRLVGIPGTVRGLALARDKFGKLPWHDLVQPAVALRGQRISLVDEIRPRPFGGGARP